MSFQPIIDYSQTLQITKKGIVGKTVTRSGVIRTVDRGNAVWRFTATLPSGLPWDLNRQIINEYETLGEFTNDTVDFTNSGYSWMFPYRGDEPNIANVTVSKIADGNQIVIQSGVTITSGFIFRKGDIIELVGGRVYEITNDVAWDDTAITLHRPTVDEDIDTYAIRVGPNARHTIQMVSQPEWFWISRNQIGFSGPFVFQEVMP